MLSDSELLSSGQLLGIIKNEGLESNNATDSEERGLETVYNSLKERNCNNLIWIDSGSCCYALYSLLPSDQVLQQQSPLALSKDLKNPVEFDGLRKAHVCDAAAVMKYLAWLDR